VLIGSRRPQRRLFDDMTWSTDQVMAQTREGLAHDDLSRLELPSGTWIGRRIWRGRALFGCELPPANLGIFI